MDNRHFVSSVNSRYPLFIKGRFDNDTKTSGMWYFEFCNEELYELVSSYNYNENFIAAVNFIKVEIINKLRYCLSSIDNECLII